VTTDQRGSGFSRFAGPVDIGAFELPNAPPVADAGGPYSVSEGSSIVLNASGSTDAEDASSALTYQWDFDGDGQFDDATGINPTISALDGPRVHTVTVRVTDSGGLTDTATATVTIANLPPTASVSGPTVAIRGKPLTFTLTATDPAPADQAAGFTFEIDWDADGTIDQTVIGPSGMTVQHAYPEAGAHTMRVTATDKDGGVSPAATATVAVTAAAIAPDPLDPEKVALFVGGTTHDDLIVVSPGLTSGSYTVTILTPGPHGLDLTVGVFRPQPGRWEVEWTLGGSSVSMFTLPLTGSLSRIVVHAQGGNDDVTVAGGITAAAWLYGGDGNDRLKSGGGSNVLLGGAGDDLLIGGRARDLLIGGAGADHLIGGAGDDILIGGTTAFDANEQALAAIRAEWNSTRDFATRVANLAGTGTGPRANGGFFLLLDGPHATVFNDGTADVLTGASGVDWEFTS
jgi:Ca2+-binding RTX toxin-like protein